MKQGIDFPPEYLNRVQEEISKQLVDAKLFEEVLQPGRHSAQAEAPVLRLSGTIHNYKQGSRKKRYIRLASHLQKEVNHATADGFYASPHTLAALGPYLTVLMQKPPATSTVRYQYLVAEPLMMANAKKDTEKHQSEGYTLLDETELSGIHILPFEKLAEEGKK